MIRSRDNCCRLLMPLPDFLIPTSSINRLIRNGRYAKERSFSKSTVFLMLSLNRSTWFAGVVVIVLKSFRPPVNIILRLITGKEMAELYIGIVQDLHITKFILY